MPDERMLRRALACVIDGGHPKLAEAIESGGPEAGWALVSRARADHPWARRAHELDLRRVVEAEEAAGLRFLIPSDPEWPDRLEPLSYCQPVDNLCGQPVGLWARGPLHLRQALTDAVAIVGSRAATAAGERAAADLAAGLVREGQAIASGAAYGVDAAAHRGALAEEGATIAFLACGADQAYPGGNSGLIERIAREGVVVSEYPPGESPTRRRFIARNRLIAATSAGVVVVEAALRSGARNTATWAGRFGRPLMAVPGSIFSSMTETPHYLIRRREAELVTSVDEILEQVRPLGTVELMRPASRRLLDLLEPGQLATLEALPSRGSRTAGQLAMKAGLSIPDTLDALNDLAERGLVEPASAGTWRLGKVADRPVAAPPLPLDEAILRGGEGR